MDDKKVKCSYIQCTEDGAFTVPVKHENLHMAIVVCKTHFDMITAGHPIAVYFYADLVE